MRIIPGSDEVFDFAEAIVEDKKDHSGQQQEALETMKTVYRIYYADPRWRKKFNIRDPDRILLKKEIKGMSNIDKIINENKDFKSFAKCLCAIYCQTPGSWILRRWTFAEEFEEPEKTKTTVFIIGNGGSAATASHMVNDLGFGVRGHIEPSLKVMSLTDNMSCYNGIGQ